MEPLINATTIIAMATFLWYRKGRLWNFYDTLVTKCTEQVKKDSLDRQCWERIALEQCAHLSRETFQSLFRFELDFLRKTILDNKYALWIPDSQATGDVETTYTDKEAFCKYRLSKLFLSDLRFCGLRLFFRSLYWRISTGEDENKGFEA